jgi:lipopolysaccharide biosynthesis glycosyltransferase
MVPIVWRKTLKDDLIKIFVGWDSREDLAFQVCKQSILDRAKFPNSIEVIPIKQQDMRDRGLHWRDEDKLASTEFTFTRFLVPELCNFKGWAMFCDCDFLFKSDVRNLWKIIEENLDKNYALMCVQHDYTPSSATKMDGQKQTTYPRKNWSSMMLFNCEHPKNKKLTKEFINKPDIDGKFLHRFSWLEDKDIGRVSHEWNWLVGVYKEDGKHTPSAIHYTDGGPWFKNYRTCEYSGDWYVAEKSYLSQKQANAKHKLTPVVWKVNDEKQDILKSVLNYLVDPQAKYYEGNTWESITERVNKHMGKIVAIDTSEVNFERKGHKYDPILENFAMGSNGIVSSYQDHLDDDTALVIRGVGGGSRKAIDKCIKTHRTFYTVDTGYFGNWKNKWLHRVTKNAMQNCGPIVERPMDRAKAHGYRYRKPTVGRKILICPPSIKAMRVFGQPDPETWVKQVVAEIKKFTNRPIEIRLKPNRTERVTDKTIQAALADDVHCLVTYNSIAAVEALMEGKPAIVLGPNAAQSICETELRNIDSPKMPDRETQDAFFAHLAYCQFDVHELRNGYAWRTVNDSSELPLWHPTKK